jgi:hypothetical protein
MQYTQAGGPFAVLLSFPWRLGTAALCALLSACGGGSDSGGSSSSSGSSSNAPARLECKVLDNANGRAVAEATVNYQALNREYRTQTNATGNCQIDIAAVDVAGGVAYPAATVSKLGYEPQTILCAGLQPGGTCSQEVRLIPLATNISIPVGGDTVMHLGDDAFSGTANSQFQKPSDGLALSFPIADWAAQVGKPGVTTATVYLDAKGWESESCQNELAIVGDAGTATLRGGVSPAGGYWAGGRQVPFVFKVAEVGKLRAELKVVSGTCSGTPDHDDFEINRLRVEFN